MAQHNLFRGGLSTRKNGWSFAMFPSTDVGPNDFMESAAHKTPVDYAITWGLAPGHQCHETPQREGFMAQHAYFRDLEQPLAVGDVINAVILPRFSSLIDLMFINCCPQPGLEFEVRIRGNADSLGGSEAAPVPLTIATIDMGQVTWGSILPLPAQPSGDGSSANGGEKDPVTGEYDPGDVFLTGQPGTIYFNQNDMLQLVITSLPEEGIDMNCLRFAITPVIREYLRGDWISCMDCCGAPPAVPTPGSTEPVVVPGVPAAETSVVPPGGAVAEGDTVPLNVNINDSNGDPVSGATVTFQVVDGDGSVSPDQTTTGALGEATTTFTGGTEQSTIVVTANGIYIGTIIIDPVA